MSNWMLKTPKLHERAKALLMAHFYDLNDSDREFLISIAGRYVVFGTELQNQRLDAIEKAMQELEL